MRTAIVVGALALLLVAWYLSFSASRLDRLHHRVEGAAAMLDTQLVRRAEAAIALAASGLLDPASGLLIAGAASDALESGEADHGAAADIQDRETAESDLTRALQFALADTESLTEARHTGVGADLVERLGSACHRVQLARRFLNQAVTDAQRVRRKRVVRWAHLAGHARLPQTFEIDDEPPAALAR